jgi:hypothetical protein
MDMRPANCRSKIPYKEVKAHERAVHVTERTGYLHNAYDCPHCDWWHLTTTKVNGKRVPFIDTSKTNQEDE